MIERDFVLRQVQQLVQVLAQVLLHKRDQQDDRAQTTLAQGIEGVLGLSLDGVRGLSREDLLAACAAEGQLSGDKAVAVADLLREDEAASGRVRALWLYEAALASGEAVPFDVYERMEALRETIEP